MRIPLAHLLLAVGLLLTVFGGFLGMSQVASSGQSCGRAFTIGIGSAGASPNPVAAPRPAERPGTYLVSAETCSLALSNQRALSLGTVLPGVTLTALGIGPTVRARWRDGRRRA